MFHRQLARLVEEHVDDDALGRRQHHVVDELLVLDVAAVAADELDLSSGERDLEHARVRGVRQVEPDHFAELGRERWIRLAADEQHVAEAAHRRVGRLGAAERRDLAVLDQDVIERQRDLAVHRRPVVRVGGLDEHVAVEAHLLAVVLADVGVVPVDAGVGEGDVRGVALAGGHRPLGLVGSVVAVLEPQPVPVDGRLQIALVLDVDDDLGALAHLQRRPGDRAVVGEHSHRGVADPLGDRRDRQVEPVTVAQLDHLRGACLGEAGGVGRELIVSCGHLQISW